MQQLLLFFNIPVMCAWDEFDFTEVLVLYLLTYKIITEQTCQSVHRLAKCPFHIGYWKNLYVFLRVSMSENEVAK